MANVLFIGGHHDDVEIGCGGTLLNHISVGDRVIVAVTHSDDSLVGSSLQRIKEQNKCCDEFHYYLIAFNSYERKNVESIIQNLDSLDPDIVFTLSEKDSHQHHVFANTIGRAVSRKPKCQLFLYSSGSAYDFYPNVFSKIDMVEKIKMVTFFKSQNEHMRLDIIRKREAFWGSLIGENYAEGFITNKSLYGGCYA